MYYTDTKRWFGNKASEENHDFAHCDTSNWGIAAVLMQCNEFKGA